MDEMRDACEASSDDYWTNSWVEDEYSPYCTSTMNMDSGVWDAPVPVWMSDNAVAAMDFKKEVRFDLTKKADF